MTPDHPLFVPGRGWVQAGELSPGDYVVGHDGNTVPIDYIDEDNRGRRVYNLTVSDYHTFFVGKGEWGFSVWVHNATVCDVSMSLQTAVLQGGDTEELLKQLNELKLQAKTNPVIARDFEVALQTDANQQLFRQLGFEPPKAPSGKTTQLGPKGQYIPKPSQVDNGKLRNIVDHISGGQSIGRERILGARNLPELVRAERALGQTGHTQAARDTINQLSKLTDLSAGDKAIVDTLIADLLNAVNTPIP